MQHIPVNKFGECLHREWVPVEGFLSMRSTSLWLSVAPSGAWVETLVPVFPGCLARSVFGVGVTIQRVKIGFPFELLTLYHEPLTMSRYFFEPLTKNIDFF